MIELNTGWLLARDQDNRGTRDRWFSAISPEARPAPVPGIIQQVYTDYHGVAWYWCSFRLPSEAWRGQRVLVRFGAVDYAAKVWMNGREVGGHEGGETPFEIDVTGFLRSRGPNLLAVRVVNPAHERIDGMVLNEVPHRNKTVPQVCGSGFNYGGMVLPVQIWILPALRVSDLFAQPDRHSGEIRVTLTVRNDTKSARDSLLSVAVEAQNAGEVVARREARIRCPRGDSSHEISLRVPQVHEWSIDDPYLYRLTAAVGEHRRTVRIGFRELRVEDGWFVLNGRRLFLKSTHTGNDMPVGRCVPPNADLMRRDLLYAKACGYNCVRFISGVAWPDQLDYCDEIGLMVHEESLAGWCLADSPDMKRRFDLSTREMVLRDRNHPSVTIWGLLNETKDGPVFRHAVGTLGLVRDLDSTRLVLLGGGRWDCQPSIGSVCNPGSRKWEHQWGGEAPGAKPVSSELNTKILGYFDRAGDAHVYPRVPQTAEASAFIRSLGRETKPVFLSEYGIGSLQNVIGELRRYEQAGASHDLSDARYFRDTVAKYERDWKRWDMGSAYPFPEDMLRDSQRLHMRQRRMGFDLIRANPRLCGYNLTGMLDHAFTGEGMWTLWREFKPLAVDTLRDGWAPLRWCLFVTPSHASAGRALEIEAVLANEDVLPPGKYPARFRIFGPEGLAWEARAEVLIPRPRGGDRSPLAVPVLKRRVTLRAPAGEYTFAADLERGGSPAGDRTTFQLADASALPALSGSVVSWGLEPRATAWLEARGLRISPWSSGKMNTKGVVLVGKPSAEQAGRGWPALAEHVARGGVALCLEHTAFVQGKDRTAFLPLPRRGVCRYFYDWLYHKECVARNHPVFDGLQHGGILDWEVYGRVISSAMFSGQRTPADVACAAFSLSTCPSGYDSGIMVGAWRNGKGWLVLNTLNILTELGREPVADRLLVNMIRYAQGLAS